MLSFVVEFDTGRVLDPGKGSLFGVVAETTPLPRPNDALVGHEPPRFDWIGKPEQTNVRLNNPALAGTEDVRDLWNQQTPFAIAEEHKPLFRNRMMESLKNWDMRDGRADWTPAAMAANANVFLDDFLLFDVSKPITDASHLEIEKSTINGTTVPNRRRSDDRRGTCIDILLTWLVNHDKGEFLQGGATGATQPSMKSFPYLASAEHRAANRWQTASRCRRSPDRVWDLIGPLSGAYTAPFDRQNPNHRNGYRPVADHRDKIDGKQIIERLEEMDAAQKSYRYGGIAGIQTSNYTGTLSVKPKGAGSSVEWHVQYLPDGQAGHRHKDHRVDIAADGPREPEDPLRWSGSERNAGS